MKLWQKDKASLREVDLFTVGNDREMDLYLASADVLGSLAHIRMLESIGLLTHQEWADLSAELKQIHQGIIGGTFRLEEGSEDIHSQIEEMLTRTLGDTGKKIHSGRSRNDQVLVDIRIFLRLRLQELAESARDFFNLLISLSEKHRQDLYPGYSHLQIAMPSSFGLWFGAYAESLVDDLILLEAAYRVVNKNPLGSAAGYGSSFPLNRSLTTELLGFDQLNYNVVYAQMGRGKTERVVAQGLSNLAATLSRLAMDLCFYMNQDLGFVSFPDELTTGSSIMPHKKNPDVLELIRAHCNRIQSLPAEISLLTANLPSGYHRDFQLLKEHLFPAFDTLKQCFSMASLMLSEMRIRKGILDEDKYRNLFSVEEVNRLVLEGIPFRDAYRAVGKQIGEGSFKPTREIHHTLEGSIGNLCNDQITRMMEEVWLDFHFDKPREAVQRLLS
ncbi:MAG TPA: argininosuccinate lyase [Chitinophagaceae bacterium]|nr:argininosuccinate lyase [Chitinophagaceae bacterium]